MIERAVLASSNSKKLSELSVLLVPLNIQICSQAELGVDPAKETGTTFVENALIKARHAASRTGLPAIADDSGLVVRGLGGLPGVRSARFAGEDASDAENNLKLVGALTKVPKEDPRRQAFFVSTVAYLFKPDDPFPVISTASWAGRIIDNPKGSNGFGYDPHFLVDGLGQTSAELPPDRKNLLSHRGQAVRLFLTEFKRRRGCEAQFGQLNPR